MKDITIKRLCERAIIGLGQIPVLRDCMPNKLYLSVLYRYTTGRVLDWKNLTRYTEKIQWLKLYDHDDLYTLMADKYLVKGYVSSKIGEQYVIPLISVYSNPRSIDFDTLPNSFVLKCNHDGGVIIVRDKSSADYNEIREELKKHLKRKFYYNGREWPYKNIKPCIICEEYLEDSSGELNDYKVMCFNGKAKLIQAHKGRFREHTQDYYDANWQKLQLCQLDTPNSKEVLDKPLFFDEMIRLSEHLAKGIRHVRVDWYDYNGRLLFGEFTFYDSAGFVDFYPDEWNDRVGEWIEI